MNYYLSSYKFGDETSDFEALLKIYKKIAILPNAGDGLGLSAAMVHQFLQKEINILQGYGAETQILDLKNYFENPEALKNVLDEFDGVWVPGGNTFILRQAMRLSGFDKFLMQKIQSKEKFLYSGYSAGICVLCDSLKPIDQVDDPFNFPYSQMKTPIWEGLGIFKLIFLPHFESNHPESSLIDQEIKRCKAQNWTYRALKDGEVLIF